MVRVCRGRGGFGLKQSFRSLYNELPHLNWFETIIRVPLQPTILVVHVICVDFWPALLQHYVFLVGGFEMYLIALALQITILLCCRIHSIIGRAMSTSGVKVTRFSLNAKRDSNSIKISALAYFGQCQFT